MHMGKRKKETPANVVPPIEIPLKLLTVKQVAGVLQVSPNQVYRHIRRDGLPTVKIDNGFMRVSLTSLQRWIAEHEQAS
jgi:excisionase family DNA binding protein